MVRIRNLHFGYSRKRPLFQNLNLTLERGHIYGLLGKNGAGKSTLLKNIVGLAFPQAGTCEVLGQPAGKRLPAVLADLFFLPEEVYVPAVTAANFVAHTAGFYPKFDHQALNHYLSEFEVPNEAVLNKLSFGQQKKFMIAFALAANTSLLVLDEPTNGLDIPSKVQFRKIVASALTEERCVVVSTHQVRDLDSLIDSVLVLHGQRVVLNADLGELAERLRFASVSEPDETALYSESSLLGSHVIQPNRGGVPGRVDLELLFNALVSEAPALTEYLTQTQFSHEPVL
ncbi:ABC transporter ATP-binding protein [Hymenobacter properus]|uniref:ABC transporter ATP-binding protein n=1 Tax=Hymenobacter properus TaxID=2791026 RepID=A0A931BDU5_9BACT|nr:ABC transporter ATP-binding protein [Hymenobacter properus]MBF9142055.1 ABC transporter ATP-binding protein [Hymenobacter properus]MBR7720862.1 ABC transporter ATP-binding protein [Microvirga sp. SRT04]